MSAHFELELENLPTYTDSKQHLTLEVGENDTLVFVGLWPTDGSEQLMRRCMLEVEQAEMLVRALGAVIDRAKAKTA